jgi:tape measure domain-containing protein
MANVGTLSIKFTGDAKQLEDTFTRVGVKSNLLASGIESAFKSAVGFARDFVTSAINVASTTENTITSFKNLTGSANEASKLYKELLDFAAKTPFNTQQINSGAVTLLGFGLNAKEAASAIKELGAAAAANADTDLKRLVVSYGQIQGANVAMTRDLREFVNNGIPIYQLLADTLGVSTDKINEMASAGQITGDIITRVFREAAQEGGRFGDTLETQSQTLAGLVSTLKDNYAITIGKLGEKLLPAAKEAVKFLNEQLEEFQKYLETDAFNKFQAGVTSVIKNLGFLGEAARNAAGSFLALYNAGRALGQLWDGDLTGAFNSARIAAEEYLKPLDNIRLITDAARKATGSYVDELRKLRASGRGLGFLTPDKPTAPPKAPSAPGIDPDKAKRARDKAFQDELDYRKRVRDVEEAADRDFEESLNKRLAQEKKYNDERNKLFAEYTKEALSLQKQLDAEIQKEIDEKNKRGQTTINQKEAEEDAAREAALKRQAEAQNNLSTAIAASSAIAAQYGSNLSKAYAEGATGARAYARAALETAKDFPRSRSPPSETVASCTVPRWH